MSDRNVDVQKHGVRRSQRKLSLPGVKTPMANPAELVSSPPASRRPPWEFRSREQPVR